MTLRLDTSRFPSLKESVRAHWAPILLEPISGSDERFVIGVAAANATGFHVELANCHEKLTCFYGENAPTIVNAITLAGMCLREDLAERSVEALFSPDPPVSGVTIGKCREAEGVSLEALTQSWMAALSSLYSPRTSHDVQPLTMLAVGDAEGQRAGDRLPFLVCEFVKSQREGFGEYFSTDIREARARRSKGGSHRVVIDFAGPRLVANFGTLKAGAITNSVHLIKRRLWDLKVERDREPHSILARAHEMILHRPPKDDPQVSEQQQANISEALEDLEQQADQEELRLLALDTVQSIGNRVLQYELSA